MSSNLSYKSLLTFWCVLIIVSLFSCGSKALNDSDTEPIVLTPLDPVAVADLSEPRDAKQDVVYYYERRYTFKGILRQNTEDLCETGEPHTYYYIEIAPIDIMCEDEDSQIDEPLQGVTELQLHSDDFNLDEIGKPIIVAGDLIFNIAGCHNHTPAYLENVIRE